MADTAAADDKKLAESGQMNKLFRALAILHSNVVHRVMRPEGATAKITQAQEETARLIAEANRAGNHKCAPGTIWDESLRRCVPLQ
jgi:hypothetical protein